MNYKKQIDKLRKNRELVLFNIEQVCDDMMDLEKNDLEMLMYEHKEYTWLLKDMDNKIEALQPIWRRLLGMKY